MATGIHAQFELHGAGCPAAALSEAGTVKSVTVDRGDSGVVGEVTVEGTDAGAAVDDAEEVFADGSRSVYRFSHDDECPCSRVPNHGCPVREIRAEGSRLRLTLIVPDRETLRTVAAELRAYCDDVRVRRLVRSGDEDRTLLVADRSAFTDRQFEVLETAHEMGYFDSPKRATADTVAGELGIAVSTFVEHLSTAQTKLFDQIVPAQSCDSAART
jgi:predicted DNA binding protein